MSIAVPTAAQVRDELRARLHLAETELSEERRRRELLELECTELRDERNRLIDAIMPNPKGIDDALTWLEAERAAAQRETEELAGYVERENTRLTDSEAFGAGFVEGRLAHLCSKTHPLLTFGWGGLDSLLARREAGLRSLVTRACNQLERALIVAHGERGKTSFNLRSLRVELARHAVPDTSRRPEARELRAELVAMHGAEQVDRWITVLAPVFAAEGGATRERDEALARVHDAVDDAHGTTNDPPVRRLLAGALDTLAELRTTEAP